MLPDSVVDFETNDEKVLNESFKIDFEKKRIGSRIGALDAVKQAVHIALLTPRYKYPIFSHAYGTDYSGIFDEGYLKAIAKLKNAVCDSLLCDERIRAVEDFEFERMGTRVKMKFKVRSVFGDFEQETEAGE